MDDIKNSLGERFGDRGVYVPSRELSYYEGVDSRSLPFLYKETRTLRQRLEANALEKRMRDDGVRLLDPSYPIPRPWQYLLEFLTREGVLAHPRVTFDPIFNDEPKLYALRLWGRQAVTDGRPEISSGGYSRGVSTDFGEALSKVAGELLERYPLMTYRNDTFTRASIASLRSSSAAFLDPVHASLFSQWQIGRYGRRQFDEHSVFNFVRGESLTRGREAYIPAQMVFINYQLADNEPFIREFNSNGAGGYFSREGAILSGLYELIQRDAFLQTWLLRKTPPRVDLDALDDRKLRELISECRRYELEVSLISCESELKVPVFVALLIDKSGKGPALALGGGCGFNEERAMTRALTEAIGVRSWLRFNRMLEKTLPQMDEVEPFTVEWGPRRRQFLWDSPSELPKIDFLLKGPLMSPRPTRMFGSSQQELEYLLSLFENGGPHFEVFAYEAKHPVLKRAGYHSVKVCVPALLPLYMGETNAPLGSPRLALHGRKGRNDPATLNPYPHPFP